MLLSVWCWCSVETCEKSCHACHFASAMDRFPFHSISSTHLLRAPHLVYTTKWQCAILTEILSKINFQESPSIKCCCLSFNTTHCLPQWECMKITNWRGFVLIISKPRFAFSHHIKGICTACKNISLLTPQKPLCYYELLSLKDLLLNHIQILSH